MPIGYAVRRFLLTLLLVAGVASSAQAQTLICKVTWEKDCIDAFLKRQECSHEFGPLNEKGTLAVDVDGSKIKTRDLGVVNDYSFVRRPGDWMLEGSWDNPGYYMRGHGTLVPTTGKLKLYFTLGKTRDDHNILQRGLEADCR